jgi:hypothetical protein
MSERIVTVASTTDITLATMWRELLAAEGIRAVIGGSNSVYVMMPGMGVIELLVNEADVVRARELIDEAEGEDPDSAGTPDPPPVP